MWASEISYGFVLFMRLNSALFKFNRKKKIIGNCQIASTAYSLFSDIEIVHLEPTNVHGNIASIVRFVVASAHVAFVRRCWSRAWKGVRNREIDRWIESYSFHSQIIQTILAIHFRNFFLLFIFLNQTEWERKKFVAKVNVCISIC